MNNVMLKTIVYYLQLAWSKPLYGIVPAVLVMAIGTIYVFNIPRSFYAEALVIMEPQDAASSLLPTTVASERLQFIEQRVLARESLLALAKKFDLYPELQPTLAKTKLADLVRKGISIRVVASTATEQNAGSVAFRIGFQYNDGARAAAVATELVDIIIEQNKRFRISKASETAEFLLREVNVLQESLTAKEQDWRKFHEESKDALPGRIPVWLTELQEKQRDLSSVDQSITTLSGEVGLLEARLRLGTEQSDQTSRFRSQAAALRTELAEKSLSYSDSHPEIILMKQRIAVLDKQVAEDEAKGTGSNPALPQNLSPELALFAEQIALAKPRHEALVEQRERLLDRMSWLTTTIARAPEVEMRIGAIQTERLALNRNLDDMKRRLETARLGERLELDSAVQMQVIEEPEVPPYPTEPRRMRLMMIIAAIAGMFGAAGIYLADMFRPYIRGAFDLADLLQGETLVMIPDRNARNFAFAGVRLPGSRGRYP